MSSQPHKLDLAAQIAVGHRPAGGPYAVTVSDGPRHLTREYQFLVRLTERPDDMPEIVSEWIVRPDRWQEELVAAMAPASRDPVDVCTPSVDRPH